MNSKDEQSSSTTGSAREALLRAATELFGEKGPAGVSTREIAAEAKVNSGLIHRHFRTKDALLREALQRLAQEISATEQAGSVGDNLVRFFYATHERTLYWKLLARCILDGRAPEQLQTEFPTVERMVELVERMQSAGWGPQDTDARNLAALMVAMALGWLLFEPWLVRAAGLADEDLGKVRRDTLRAARALIGFPEA